MSLYYVDMLEVLRAAGLWCRENGTTAGWQSRARASGGFPSPPLGVWWHHTASDTSPENDLAYMIDGSPDAPVGNMLLDRAGVCWPIAAGASNCAGQGGPVQFSRGVCPVDSGNSRGWQIEVANNGVGQAWPQVQVDAFFTASNALNARFGNVPTDVCTHSIAEGGGWTSRKIDPATASAVQGPWRPGSANSSGTWRLADVRAECSRRAASHPPPTGGGLISEMEEALIYFVSPNNEQNPSLWASNVATKWLVEGQTMRDDLMAVQEIRLAACGMDPATARGFSKVFLCSEGSFRAYGLAVGPDNHLAGRDEYGWKL